MAVERGYHRAAALAYIFIVASAIIATLALLSLTSAMGIWIASVLRGEMPTLASLLKVASAIVTTMALVPLPAAMGIGTARAEVRFRLQRAILRPAASS